MCLESPVPRWSSPRFSCSTSASCRPGCSTSRSRQFRTSSEQSSCRLEACSHFVALNDHKGHQGHKVIRDLISVSLVSLVVIQSYCGDRKEISTAQREPVLGQPRKHETTKLRTGSC